jgi:hypothetical protein
MLDHSGNQFFQVTAIASQATRAFSCLSPLLCAGTDCHKNDIDIWAFCNPQKAPSLFHSLAEITLKCGPQIRAATTITLAKALK